jgi:hypothetical protein
MALLGEEESRNFDDTYAVSGMVRRSVHKPPSPTVERVPRSHWVILFCVEDCARSQPGFGWAVSVWVLPYKNTVA